MARTDSSLSDGERRAVAAISLMAAQADGLRDEERARLGELFEALGGVDTARLYQDVLLGRVELGEAARTLTTPGLRAYAYEMAVGVCDADGHTTGAERAFLDRLGGELGLATAAVDAVREEAEALADAPHAGSVPLVAVGADAARPGSDGAAPDAGATASPLAADLDRTILNRAILAGGLELLAIAGVGLTSHTSPS